MYNEAKELKGLVAGSEVQIVVTWITFPDGNIQ